MGTMEKDVMLEGSGKNRKEAFSNAMGTLQKALGGGDNQYFLRIEPLEVQIIEGKEYISYEKFMFLFLKRKISRFEVKLKVKVRCFVVLDDFDYEQIYLKNKLISSNPSM